MESPRKPKNKRVCGVCVCVCARASVCVCVCVRVCVCEGTDC